MNKIKKVISMILSRNKLLKINTNIDKVIKVKPKYPKNFIGEKIKKILKIK